MTELRTDEEQIQALSNWWKENGKSLLFSIAIALAVVAGWKAWQKHQATQAQSASILYQNLIQAAQPSNPMEALAKATEQSGDVANNDAKLITANHLAQQLKIEHENTTYAIYASFILARINIEKGDFDAAITELDWILEHKPEQQLLVLVYLRKGRLLAAQGKLKLALELINSIPDGPYKAQVYELKGDLYLTDNNKEQALSAYKNAIAAGNKQPLLEMKLNDLATGDN